MVWFRECNGQARRNYWKSRLTWSSQHASDLNNVFYSDYRIFWFILKIFGLFPYHIDKEGDLKFKLFSKEMLYSVVIYGLTSIPVVKVLKLRFDQRLQFSGNFDHEICLYLLVFLLTPHFLIPATHWVAMRRTTAAFEKWRNFERVYDEVMLQKLCLRWQWSTHLYLLPGIMLISAAVAFEYSLQAFDYCWEMMAHVYILFLLLIHLIIFLGIGFRLIQVARDIRLKLLNAILSNDLVLVRCVSSVWVRLSESVTSLGCIFTRMFGYILLMIFVTSTITIYSLIKAFLANDLGRWELFYQLACLYNNNLWLFFMCDCGHRLTIEIGQKFVRQIATVKSSVKCKDMMNELDSLLCTITSYPTILSLNGYVTINRPLFVAMKGTMATYLIVVLQFSQDYSTPLTLGGNSTDFSKRIESKCRLYA